MRTGPETRSKTRVPRRFLMPRLFTAIVLPLLLAPSLGVAQRADIRAQSSNPAFVIPATSVTRLSSGEGTRGHFWAGAGIGLLGGALIGGARSEERRGGEEGRSRWAPDH